MSEYVFGIEHIVVKKLLENNRKIAVAESCTGGLLLEKLTSVNGASACLDFGIVSYGNWVKNKFLKVPKRILANHGAVSPQTAYYMAKNARIKGKADIGVSITGIAGPGGGTDEKPVGLVYIGVSTKHNIHIKKLNIPCKYSREDSEINSEINFKDKNRRYIRNYSAEYALNMVLAVCRSEFQDF